MAARESMWPASKKIGKRDIMVLRCFGSESRMFELFIVGFEALMGSKLAFSDKMPT